MGLAVKMVSLDNAVIVGLRTHGHTFEIFVDPDKALAYRSGGDIPTDEILAVQNVFKDASAAEKASEELMNEVFDSSDPLVVSEKIIKKGELHLTTEQKSKMLENRRKQVVSLIARNAINPQTRTPHPPDRIERAMEQAKAQISINKSAEEQVEVVMKALKPIIPIKFDNVEVAVKIPATYAGKLHTVFQGFGSIKNEEWIGQEQYVLIEIPAGLQDDFYNKLNNMTHGEVKIKVVR